MADLRTGISFDCSNEELNAHKQVVDIKRKECCFTCAVKLIMRHPKEKWKAKIQSRQLDTMVSPKCQLCGNYLQDEIGL